MQRQWLKHPKPNNEVVQALEQALAAAKRGQLRAVVVVTVNPLHETESLAAGADNPVLHTVLVGAMAKAYSELISK